MARDITKRQAVLSMDNQNQQIVWQFIRGDLPVQEFEKWLYANNDFENTVGQEFYLELISANFKANPDVYLLKQKLGEFMRQKVPLSCECVALPNLAVTDMGSEQEEHIWETLEEAKVYGEARWWLALYKCKKCGQYWLVAQESCHNDIHCLKRLETIEAETIIQNDEWPKSFETLEELLTIGRDNNRSVLFIDPSDSSLAYCAEDLLKTRPDISVSEIASLLNIDKSLAAQIYNKVSSAKKPWWKFWN
jgi:hypothetical protein